jgi:heptaprenyl diphosphate synthase
LGKPAGLDLAEGIYTLPVIYALRDSTELRSLLGGPLDPSGVALGRKLACGNGAVTSALEVAERHVEAAGAALEGGGLDLDPEIVEGLRRLSRQVLDQPAGVSS